MGLDRDVSRNVIRLSRAQNSAIRSGQLQRAGMSPDAIRSRVRSGRLVPVFRGVYLTADPELVPLARPSAALLSLGPDALVSHRSAAAVWGLAVADPETVDVTVVGRRPRTRDRVRLHLVSHLHPADITTHCNLRITSPARTLIDFAAPATPTELYDAFGDARARGLISDAKLKSALKRVPANHPGAAVIRAMFREGDTYDRSKAERIMRRLCRQADLPQPLTNRPLNGFRVDFYWPDFRLILEVDGHLTHGDRRAFEEDRRRDQIHVAAGYVVIRVTWRQLQKEPLAVLVRIAQALAQRAA